MPVLERALTTHQKSVLSTVVGLCPEPGQEVSDDEVARRLGVTRRVVVLSLPALRLRGLLDVIPEAPHNVVRPTWEGRQWVRTVTDKQRFARLCDRPRRAPVPDHEPSDLTQLQLAILACVARLDPVGDAKPPREKEIALASGVSERVVLLTARALEGRGLVVVTPYRGKRRLTPTDKGRAWARPIMEAQATLAAQRLEAAARRAKEGGGEGTGTGTGTGK